MSFLTLLPLSFVMIAGAQIVSSVFLATSENWRRNSGAYVLGAALSITLMVTIAFFALNGISDAGASDDTLYIVVLVLLVLAALHTFRTRKTAEPPKWMGKLQTASPRFCFKLGFLLMGFFPTDLLTSVAVGTYLAAHGDPWWHCLGFIALTLLFLALPALVVLVIGHRAQEVLPKVRDWMTTNSWVVNELVICFFIVLTATNL
jgi:Sap-like sulfolipid-1-addressing protein